MTKKEKKYYFMEDDRENHRLASKVDPAKFVEKYLKQYLYEGIRTLDIGSGPGVISSAIGKEIPYSKTAALDISSSRTAEADKNMSATESSAVVQGDANFLPFDSNQFDFVFARFLLEYIHKPQKVVSEMIRVCRPGGRIFMQDLDGQLIWLYPETAELKPHIKKAVNYLSSQTGFDPFVGRKLFNIAYSSGLKNIDVQAESYHLFPGKIDEKNYNLWKTKLDIAMPMITRALKSKARALELKNEYLDYLLREDTLMYCSLYSYGFKAIRRFTYETIKQE
jgi:ubiquinone/menaquinone biosynthesis C-methylase UbiE